METNDISKHLTFDNKPDDNLCEVTSSHVNVHAILNYHSFDSNSIIENLQFQRTSKSRFLNPLYRLLSMPLVQPTLMSDVLKLEQGFIDRYRFGSAIVHISVVNNQIKTENVTSELIKSWNMH